MTQESTVMTEAEAKEKEKKITIRQIDKSLATVAAPILAALAALFLGVMLQVQDKPAVDASGTNGLLCALAVLALAGAALNIDAYLDDENLKFGTRVWMAGGGYLCFVSVISGLNATTLIMYSMGERGLHVVTNIPYVQLVLFAASSIALAGKMLSYEDKEIWLAVLIASYVATLYLLSTW